MRMLVNTESSSDAPRAAGPLILTSDAEVRFRVCITLEDPGAVGLDAVGEESG